MFENGSVGVGTGNQPRVGFSNTDLSDDKSIDSTLAVEGDIITKRVCFSDQRKFHRRGGILPQSGMETSADGTTNDNRIMRVLGDQKQQNVKFSDQVDPYLMRLIHKLIQLVDYKILMTPLCKISFRVQLR